MRKGLAHALPSRAAPDAAAATAVRIAVDNSLAQDREALGPEAFQAQHPDRCAYGHIELALLDD
ncbi:hypothetical protein KW797_02745 [Candidatus Parcubacteria bacterium]|nr:hypothetical protein [Candidatus Parcubacteria bacterium]